MGDRKKIIKKYMFMLCIMINNKDRFDLREKEVKAGMRINTLMELTGPESPTVVVQN